MKKLTFVMFFAMIAMNLGIVKADVATKTTPVASTVVNSPVVSDQSKSDQAEVNNMVARLKEIKGMDKSNMTRAEKHELRKEVLAIREKLRQEHATYVYISGGALILIIILLIILL
jgi:hypothetical protein